MLSILIGDIQKVEPAIYGSRGAEGAVCVVLGGILSRPEEPAAADHR